MDIPARFRHQHPRLAQWIEECAQLCKPARIHLCDGSQAEFDRLADEMVKKGSFIRLDSSKRPRSYLARSTSDDVARVEDRTFVCSTQREDAGPTNNWRDPEDMRKLLHQLFSGCMQGRTLYVIPFSMGPLHSPLSQHGVQITDSPYVVCSMSIMTRMGTQALEALGDGAFVKCMHSLGFPLRPGVQDVPWPCNSKDKYIVHFPQERAIWSYGSGYGGNALLGKKCFALRIASVMGREEGWLAEHMLVLGITNPQGKKYYIAAAFPSACGKTNLAMLTPTLPGWKVECIGDDIAWIRPGEDGRLYAINPENGFFGVAPGTSMTSNPNAMRTITHDTLFTNAALTSDGDVWWEQMTPEPPSGLTDWHGRRWSPDLKEPAAHPNARFTAPIEQCPVIDPAFNSPQGVPISAILFGGRRASIVPLVYQARTWKHGVLIGAMVSSQTTAAAEGAVGKLRHDPFAMLPFCGYHMGDYFSHWLDMGERPSEKLPKIFYVNWFRKGTNGEYLWPGYGENSRVLKWIIEQCEGQERSVECPIGYIPSEGALDLTGLDIGPETMKQLFAIDRQEWMREVEHMSEYLQLFGDRLPQALLLELDILRKQLGSL